VIIPPSSPLLFPGPESRLFKLHPFESVLRPSKTNSVTHRPCPMEGLSGCPPDSPCLCRSQQEVLFKHVGFFPLLTTPSSCNLRENGTGLPPSKLPRCPKPSLLTYQPFIPVPGKDLTPQLSIRRTWDRLNSVVNVHRTFPAFEVQTGPWLKYSTLPLELCP